jgi:hypothetical protein
MLFALASDECHASIVGREVESTRSLAARAFFLTGNNPSSCSEGSM